MEDKMTLIERLQNPMWCHSDAPFDSPQLEKDQTLDDMREAARRIEVLESSEANEIAQLRTLAKRMRNAIDMIEGALMGFGDLHDLPHKWGEPRHRTELRCSLPVTAGEIYRVCDALTELTDIINDDDIFELVNPPPPGAVSVTSGIRE